MVKPPFLSIGRATYTDIHIQIKNPVSDLVVLAISTSSATALFFSSSPSSSSLLFSAPDLSRAQIPTTMNNLGGEDNSSPFCYVHPKKAVVGVCALCLKEKLLVLASKQGRLLQKEQARHGSFSRALSKRPSVPIPKVFALGSSFLHPRNPGADDSDESSIDSLDDSFISIEFEDDGQTSWDKMATDPDAGSTAAPRSHSSPRAAGAGAEAAQCLVEHAGRPRGAVRWRKRIGHLLQLLRWKRVSKASVCHVRLAAKAEGANGRSGWARSLATTRATE